jgi:hypothetical protein
MQAAMMLEQAGQASGWVPHTKVTLLKCCPPFAQLLNAGGHAA